MLGSVRRTHSAWRVSLSGAQHRGLAPSCRHAVDRVAKATDGFALAEAGDNVEFFSVSFGTFHKLLEASPSTLSPAFMYVSIAQASVIPESRLV